MKTCKISIQLEKPYVEGLKRQAREDGMTLKEYVEEWARGSVLLQWSIDKKGRLRKNPDY
jgi:predicted DNA-binding ribbon-helix-helix protein